MSDTVVVLICADCGIWINVDVRYASPEWMCSVFNELGESGSDHPGSKFLAFVGVFFVGFFLKANHHLETGAGCVIQTGPHVSICASTSVLISRT